MKMKVPILSVICMVLSSTVAWSQTVQRGYVKEYKEDAKKSDLSGVEINVRSAGSTVSDKKGRFSLDFLTLKPGEKVNVRKVEKPGYEIFNKEALEQWNINPNEPFTIVMCRSDRFKKIRDNYEKISSESYARQLKKDEQKLRQALNEGKLKEEEYKKQLVELRENYETQLDRLANYVDRFSRIDISELNETEQKIIKMLGEGRIEDAIREYENQGYVRKFVDGIERRAEITDAIGKLNEAKANIEEDNKSLLGGIERQIQALQLAGGVENIAKIIDIVKTVADADTTNYDLQMKAGDYIYDYSDEIAAALPYYYRAMHIAERESDEMPSRRAAVYNRLGNYYQLTANIPLAKKFHGQSLEINNELYGETSFQATRDLCNLGLLNYDDGDHDEALRLFFKAIDNINLIPEDDPQRYFIEYGVNVNTGRVFLHGKCQWDEAEKYFMKALKVLEDRKPDDLLSFALVYDNLGNVKRDQAQYDSALFYITEALEIRKEILGDNHRRTAESYNSLASLYNIMGDYEKAHKYYNKTLQIRESNFGKDSTKAARTRNSIASLYLRQGEAAKAREILESIRPIFLSYSGETSLDMCDLYSDLAISYMLENRYNDALDPLNKAVEIAQNLTTGGNYSIATNLFNRGMAWLNLGHNENAAEDFRNSIDNYLKTSGLKEPMLPSAYLSLGQALEHMGKIEECLDAYNKARELFGNEPKKNETTLKWLDEEIGILQKNK